MFQFGRFPAYAYVFSICCACITSRGFPHSEICGSTDICSSPQLIAACHVLRRLLVPRHSPCALFSLTFELYGQISRFRRFPQFLFPFKTFLFLEIFIASSFFALSALLSLFGFQGTVLRVSGFYRSHFLAAAFLCPAAWQKPDFNIQSSYCPSLDTEIHFSLFVMVIRGLKWLELWWAQVDSNHRPFWLSDSASLRRGSARSPLLSTFAPGINF
jgi:hypothetical protein